MNENNNKEPTMKNLSTIYMITVNLNNMYTSKGGDLKRKALPTLEQVNKQKQRNYPVH